MVTISTTTNSKRYYISISDQHYTHKPTEYEVAHTTYTPKAVTPEELLNTYILNGHSFTGIFDGDLKGSGRIKDFNEVPYIGFDCDEMDSTMEDYLKSLPIQPTIAYTTPSDGVNGNRFRLIYFLDKSMTSADEVKCRYYGLKEYLGIDKMKDNCGCSCARYFNGNGTGNCTSFKSDTILHTDSIPYMMNDESKVSKTIKKESVETKKEYKNESEFMNDYYSMKTSDFLAKYADEYGQWNRRTKVQPNEYGVEELGDDYIEIDLIKFTTIKNKKSVAKIPVGKRTRTIFALGCSIRMINEDMDMNGLIYALTELVIAYFDNSDKQCGKYWIEKNARKIMTVEDLKSNYHTDRKFRIPDELASLTGKSKQKLVAEYKTMKKDEQIMYFFDGLLSDKENRMMLKENGIEVSPEYLKNFRIKHGLQKDKLQMIKINELMNEGLNDKQIIEKLNISRKTLYNLRKQCVKNAKQDINNSSYIYNNDPRIFYTSTEPVEEPAVEPEPINNETNEMDMKKKETKKNEVVCVPPIKVTHPFDMYPEHPVVTSAPSFTEDTTKLSSTEEVVFNSDIEYVDHDERIREIKSKTFGDVTPDDFAFMVKEITVIK